MAKIKRWMDGRMSKCIGMNRWMDGLADLKKELSIDIGMDKWMGG